MTLSDDSGNCTNRSNTDDTFRILLATDIHLGYNENDQVTGKFFLHSKKAQISQF
jgi:hypothetical protein